ncbi:hypothetical protein METUNv1_01164 [Methyloversatilis universalis FAM5]|uniref:Uncharacterized protein n=1 Tax=Methyloversatilis universalis (strain ATCC BAA-1314 / DSM 25237 / JCM 13912 / CCUG 52030 / FAM5) TaxID=1000565 RepID=F5RA84_METUF|nr:hypothetical protein METUNv1_01164 [Methyloversatilis universalis FAM5]
MIRAYRRPDFRVQRNMKTAMPAAKSSACEGSGTVDAIAPDVMPALPP